MPEDDDKQLPAPVVARQQELLKELGEPGQQYREWLQSLPKDMQTRVRSHVRSIKHGLHAIAPLVCTGPSGCPFLGACPLVTLDGGGKPQYQSGVFPVGLQCVLEKEFMNQKTAEYLLHLGVDPANPVETAMVGELAVLALRINRAHLVLAHGDSQGQGRDFLHVDESVTGHARGTGEPLVSKTTKLHPVAEYIQTLERQRVQLLDRLLETRKARAEVEIKMGKTKKSSKLLDEMREIKQFVTSLQKRGAGTPALTGPTDEPDDTDDSVGLDDDEDMI